jgi:hypothetical protein
MSLRLERLLVKRNVEKAATDFRRLLWIEGKKSHVDEDRVNVVGAVVALEGGDVRPEVVGCKRRKQPSKRGVGSTIFADFDQL